MKKRRFKNPERSQLLLVANVDMESIAVPGGVLRTIDGLIDTLDTKEIEKQYDLESELGAEPFHPKTLLKVGLYALYNCRFSLRKMEEDTIMNLGYKWLTGNVSIDHTTLGKFFAKHKDAISNLLAQVVGICKERDLISFDILAIDSVKIRANASYKQFRTMEGIEKEQKKIRAKLDSLISRTIQEEQALREEECRILEQRTKKLDEAKIILADRIQKKSEGKSEAERTRIATNERVNITDPDCYMVQQGNGEINPGYAFSTSVDSKADIITAAVEHDLGVNDGASLAPTIEESRCNCQAPHATIVADSGFSTINNLETLASAGQDALIPDKRFDVETRRETKRGEFDRSNFPYDESKKEYTCPRGTVLALTAVVVVNGRRIEKYANQSACAMCAFRQQCTKSQYRTITRDENESIRERMRERLATEEGKARYRMRAHAAESPFGSIKHNRGYRIFKRKGKAKVKMELSMHLMLHNILKLQAIGI